MTPWLACRERRPDAGVQLYCFPHAGGGPAEYVRWSDALPGVQVWGLRPPGRESRLAEPPFTRMTRLVEAIVESVPFERPCAFFGHSLGALVAFEAARALRDRPVRLVVSACPPPAEAVEGPALHVLPDAELLAEIDRSWGALPEAVRADPEFLAQTLVRFRADLEVLETYRYGPGAPLDCPITAVGGDRDRHTGRMRGWRDHTTGTFDLRVLPGDHFYLRDRRDELLVLLETLLKEPLE
ncbi:thioesterase II family protein [Spirillospora sp. CA-294931]|uniref:thioesterase II family protein n=1 Tax=Spirillospora sp. CA-294931 TaxID=3240042 RepID=UPI003D8D4DE8